MRSHDAILNSRFLVSRILDATDIFARVSSEKGARFFPVTAIFWAILVSFEIPRFFATIFIFSIVSLECFLPKEAIESFFFVSLDAIFPLDLKEIFSFSSGLKKRIF